MAKTNKLLVVGALGVGAYLLYKKFGTNQGAVLQPVNSPGNMSTIPNSTYNAVNAAAALPGQYGTDQPVNSNATAAQQTALFNWANSSLKPGDLAQFMKMYPSFTAADIAGFMDLFSTNWAPSPAHTTFWNNWRAKYDIDNGTYS